MNAAGSSDTPAAAAAQADPSGAADSLTPGELLRRERERRSISVQQAAEDLHLDPTTVAAIEANRFATLGVPVYARGHLRKYATLLGLSPEFIIERYESLSDRPEVPMPVPASVTALTSVDLERRSLKGPLWMSVLLVVLALGWWIFGEVTEPSSNEPPMPALTVEPPPVAAPELVEPAAAVAPAVEPPPVTPAPTPTPVAVAANAPPAAPVVVETAPAVVETKDVRLRLEYSDASWTEVYDGTGRRLLFGLGDPGRVRTITGRPPLRVTLGDASAVTVQVNDRTVAVPRESGRDSARFSIAADGAVQTMSGEVLVE